MLNWSNRFNIFCFLDNQQYRNQPHTYDCLLGAGAASVLQGGYEAFKNIDAFVNGHWAFGHLSFELLHSLYKIKSNKQEATGFPQSFFFRPQAVLYIRENTLYIEAPNPEQVYDELMAWPFEKVAPASGISLQQQLKKEDYMERVRQLQHHILRGDCYEINFCTAFFSHGAVIHPLHVFHNLMQLSAAPFSALYKLHDRYLICASPERFLTRRSSQLIAQPIKGTAARSSDASEDDRLKTTLQNSAKEQAENVMVVDLMRNDLSKICEQGSVQVDELFGLYTFPQVHQLISTISGTVKKDISFLKIIEAMFPMGSMTGAPKHRVLELIEQYEPTARGIFSGSVGYLSPDGHFDLNVVIRSIMYNETTRYLSYQAGSGLTFYSDAEREWEECLLKAAAIKKVLTG